jgi:hypothetical protein
MRTPRHLAIFLLACLSAAGAHAAAAADDPAALCAQSDQALQHADPLFPEIRDAALGVRRVLCEDGGSRPQILVAFADFVAQVRASQWFAPYGGFRDGKDPFQKVLELLGDPQGGPPTMAVVGPDAQEVLEVTGAFFEPAIRTQCDTRSGVADCARVLQEFADYYNYAQNTYVSAGAIAFAQTVSGFSREWDQYLDNGKGFTPLELLVNSYFFKRNEKSHFSSPPEIQWIVLHPEVVVENVQGALDGDNTMEALMVEVLGASWWRQDKWYLPNGGSLIAAYADRAGVKDLGYGVALHFRGTFSVGYTRHKGKGGVLVSYDLLKLLQDKQTVLKELKP